MTEVDIDQLRDIAEVEFSDIVREAISPDLNELRIILRDGSFVDVWFSLKLPGRYSYHWERRAIDKPGAHRSFEPFAAHLWPLIGILTVAKKRGEIA